MFREMRRKRQLLTEGETLDILLKGTSGVLSLLGDDGYPYGVPLSYVYHENKIYFHSAKAGHKIDAMKVNDKICLTTWDDGYLVEGDWAFYVSSCVVFGRAKLIEDRQVTEDKARILALKYFPTVEEVEYVIKKSIDRVQLVAIEIEHISGKKIHEK